MPAPEFCLQKAIHKKFFKLRKNQKPFAKRLMDNYEDHVFKHRGSGQGLGVA